MQLPHQTLWTFLIGVHPMVKTSPASVHSSLPFNR
jgi:hypothetical protein